MELEQFYCIGLSSLQNGDAQSALNLFKKAETLGLINAPLLCDIGVAYAQLGNMEKALDYSRKAIELDNSLGIAYYNIGNYYFGIDDYNLAISYLDKAILNNSQYIWNCHYLRAHSYYLISLSLWGGMLPLGDPNITKAKADIELAIERSPTIDVDIYVLAGLIYERDGMNEKAKFFLGKAKDLGDRDAARILAKME